jgi:hypothetical protein
LLSIILLEEWKLGLLGSNVESESSIVAEHDLLDIRTLPQLLDSEVHFGTKETQKPHKGNPKNQKTKVA